MNTNVQRLLDDTPTARTHLAGIMRIYRHYLNSGIDSLVIEYCAEHPQTNVMRGAGKVTILKHEFERQIFQNNYTISIYQLAGSFVPKILTLVSDMFMQAGDLLDSLVLVLATFLLARNRMLQYPHFSERCLQIFGTVKGCTI